MSCNNNVTTITTTHKSIHHLLGVMCWAEHPPMPYLRWGSQRHDPNFTEERSEAPRVPCLSSALNQGLSRWRWRWAMLLLCRQPGLLSMASLHPLYELCERTENLHIFEPRLMLVLSPPPTGESLPILQGPPRGPHPLWHLLVQTQAKRSPLISSRQRALAPWLSPPQSNPFMAVGLVANRGGSQGLETLRSIIEGTQLIPQNQVQTYFPDLGALELIHQVIPPLTFWV